MLPVVLLAVLVLGACSSGSNDESAETPATTRPETSSSVATTSSTPAGVPGWATSLGAPTTAKNVDAGGVEVWVDDANRTIYVQSCDAARALTAEGQPYGPSARDADGNYTPGFAYICPS